MADLFWLSDEQWAVIEPPVPRNQPGPELEDDRRIISGILHVITCGCRWCDCPAAYGSPATVYNRFNRWSRRGFWRTMLTALTKVGWSGKAAAIDSTYVKAHRVVRGGKGGRRRRGSAPSAAVRPPRSTRWSTSRPPRRPYPNAKQRQRRVHRPRDDG